MAIMVATMNNPNRVFLGEEYYYPDQDYYKKYNRYQ